MRDSWVAHLTFGQGGLCCLPGSRKVNKPVLINPSPLRCLRNLWIKHRPRLRRALFPKPWPDFTELEVVIAESINVFVDRFGNEKPYDKGPRFFPFPKCPPQMAVYQG